MRVLDFPHESIVITALGSPGPGGAPHEYEIAVRSPDDDEFYASHGQHKNIVECRISFQNGPLVNGWNGIIDEALIAIVLDRLECFQCGPFPHFENERAITKLQVAMQSMGARKRERAARGVLGTHHG